MSAWPIVRIATVSETPAASSCVAAPCRRPWNVTLSNPWASAALHEPENEAG